MKSVQNNIIAIAFLLKIVLLKILDATNFQCMQLTEQLDCKWSIEV